MNQQERNAVSSQYQQLDDTVYRWYVMLHKNPHLVDSYLKRENSRLQTATEKHQLLEYFIPFSFLSHVNKREGGKLAEDISAANQLREDFHDYVFIRSTQQGIARLLDSYWNKAGSSRLHHYHDFQHREVSISDGEMKTLISLFSEKRIRFSIGLPVGKISPDMQVCITDKGVFQGQTARVISVQHTAEGISLTLGMELFNGTKELKLSDVRLTSVLMEKAPDDIIGQQFIQQAELTLLDIISRRVNHKESDESSRQDSEQLSHLFLYSYVTIHDTIESAHFLALMLICSTLRFDTESTPALEKRATALLADPASPLPSHIRAYLNFALFMSTRDADYRTVAKQLVQQGPIDTPAPLRRLMSLTGRLRSKRKIHDKN